MFYLLSMPFPDCIARLRHGYGLASRVSQDKTLRFEIDRSVAQSPIRLIVSLRPITPRFFGTKML